MTPSFREMNLRVFQGLKNPHVFFQPRAEPWFDWQKRFGKLPAELEGLRVEDFYDRLGMSMRYIDYYTQQPGALSFGFDPPVEVEAVESSEDRQVVRYRTPVGDLFQTNVMTIDETWRTVDFPVKSIEDLRCLECLLHHRRIGFNEANFDIGDRYLGDRGVPQFFLPKSPYQDLAQHWMKLHDLIYALADEPRVVEGVMKAIDDSYDELYRQVCASGRVQIANFGENIHAQLLSPDYWQRYLVPWYEKRCGQLRDAGIYSHVHIDGYVRPLLPFLASIPHDGIEALTPEPQGDVSLEELRDAMGDKVLLDGIPAVYFLPHFPIEALHECVEKLVDYFGSRLILGISDELPEAADETGFEKLRWVADWAKSH